MVRKHNQITGFRGRPVRAFVSLISAMIGFNAAAADGMELSLLSESEYLGDVPTIVTASRMPQLQSEAPAAVTVIDAETINAMGVRNIVDILVLVPGFQVGNFNSSHPVVTYHGLADQYPRHMQVLVDGRSVYSPIFRGAFWFDLTVDIEDIERIEVIRGPNTVTYGSNAFFGVINIITRHASQQNGTYVKGTAGNNGIRDATVRHGWRIGEHNFRVTGALRRDNGFETRVDDVETRFINFTGDLRLSPKDTFEIDFGVNKNTNTEDFTNAGVAVSPTDREVTSQYQQLRWRNAVAQTQEISLQFYHSYRNQQLNVVTDPVDLSSLGLGVIVAPIDYNATEDRYDLEFQHNLHPSDTVQLVWGVGERLDEMQSERFFADNDVRENRVHRLFSNIEWRATKNLIINAGAIAEDSDVAGRDVSPRIAANYHLPWGDTIRASASKATRMPSLVEDEGDQQFGFDHEIFGEVLFDQNILGLGGLVTEKILTREIAYLGRVDSINLSWGVRLYRDLITDRITQIEIPVVELSPDDGYAFSFVNNGEVKVDGLELEMDYRPSEKWRILFNYARMEADAHGFDPGYTLAQRDITIERSVPEYSVNGAVMYQFASQWQLGVLAGRVARIEWLGDGDYLYGQNRVDINLARQFINKNTASSLALTVQRAGGESNDFTFENIADTQYFVTFDTQF